MTVDYAEKLVSAAEVLKPTEVPRPKDWTSVEREIGVRLPADYKQLVSALGTGRFGAGLYLRNPCASSEYILLSKDALLQYKANRKTLAERSGVSLYPAKSGAINIGGIDAQEFLLHPHASSRSHRFNILWWDLDEAKTTIVATSISKFIHDLYFGIGRQKWGEDLRNYLWRDGSLPLFVPAKVKSKG